MLWQDYSTGNSRTHLPYNAEWLVLDLGSGHRPHPRADVLLDRYHMDNTERGGQALAMPVGKRFIIGDAECLPFRDKVFDFVICSHVAEHVQDPAAFCEEMNRVGRAGYIETPSKWGEILRHPPIHRWYVSTQRGALVFERTPEGYPLGAFGKLFFSVYFYGTVHVEGRDVFGFAHRRSDLSHYFFAAIRLVLVKIWLTLRPVTYTRFIWQDRFRFYVNG
jgi:SAM-dependent methyltransferase